MHAAAITNTKGTLNPKRLTLGQRVLCEQLNILRMPTQLEYFQEYQGRVQALIGREQTKRLIEQSLVLITVGGNDFVNNYYLGPSSTRSRQFPLPTYVNYLISEYKKLLMVRKHIRTN